MPDTFRCAHCGGMFEKGSDADADAEALERFGVAQASADPSMVEVCEDCYKAMTTTLPPHAWRRHQGN